MCPTLIGCLEVGVQNASIIQSGGVSRIQEVLKYYPLYRVVGCHVFRKYLSIEVNGKIVKTLVIMH